MESYTINMPTTIQNKCMGRQL